MPKPLNFHQQWIEPIVSGSKRVTVRRAGSGYRPGDVVKAMRRNHPAFADLRIERVQTVRLEELTGRHAKLDGHATLDELRSAVAKLYPGEEKFDLISFRVA
jgi:uncharacterized protein YqfB (UPF0267 family)